MRLVKISDNTYVYICDKNIIKSEPAIGFTFFNLILNLFNWI